MESKKGTAAAAPAPAAETAADVDGCRYYKFIEQGDAARFGRPSQFRCNGFCIGGTTVGCCFAVFMCILWLSGAFAKYGFPSPIKKRKPTTPPADMQVLDVL